MIPTPRGRAPSGACRPSPRVRLATEADCGWMAGLSRDLIEAGLGWSCRPPRLARRCGVARALVRWLEESARTAGISMVYCEARATRHAARAFYRAMGYRERFLMPGYYRGVETAVRLGHDVRRPAPEAAG